MWQENSFLPSPATGLEEREEKSFRCQPGSWGCCLSCGHSHPPGEQTQLRTQPTAPHRGHPHPGLLWDPAPSCYSTCETEHLLWTPGLKQKPKSTELCSQEKATVWYCKNSNTTALLSTTALTKLQATAPETHLKTPRRCQQAVYKTQQNRKYLHTVKCITCSKGKNRFLKLVSVTCVCEA